MVSDSERIAKGDVVQIDPDHDERFGGCFMVVTEPKSWGAQGYVSVPGASVAYYRCPTEAMVKVGMAEWIASDEDDTDGE